MQHSAEVSVFLIIIYYYFWSGYKHKHLFLEQIKHVLYEDRNGPNASNMQSNLPYQITSIPDLF